MTPLMLALSVGYVLASLLMGWQIAKHVHPVFVSFAVFVCGQTLSTVAYIGAMALLDRAAQ